MSYFDKTLQGRIIARADSDIETMEHVVTWGVSQFLISILTLIGVFVILVMYNLKLCLAVSIVIPILFYGTFLMKKYGMRAYRMIREGIAHITAGYAENIAGIRVVQSFVREDYNFAGFLGINRAHSRNVVKASLVWGGYQSMVGLLRGISDLIVIGYGSYLFSRGEVEIGNLIVYVFYIHMLFEPVEMLGELYNATLSTAAAAERVFDLIDTEPSIVDHDKVIDLPRVRGNIDFKNVNFSYDGSDKWILNDINISIKQGSTVALVGPTGAGKTSFVNLIARFYENQQGSIQIDGYDIKDCSLHSLHSQISIVPQDSFLFTGTVNENIRYGMPEASDEKIVSAAKSLGAHDLIMKLRDGYETKVKERGAGLSHGERQLICFTRAYISDPTILILDEATSAVDAHTEYLVHDAVHTMTKDRTTFIIAHRLSTARLADLILVVEDGRIAESGTHNELSAKKGSYSRLLEHYRGNLSE